MKLHNQMATKVFSYITFLQFLVVDSVKITHYQMENTIRTSMSIIETITDNEDYSICARKCARQQLCIGSKFEETNIENSASCKLIGHKALDAATQQMDIANAFFKLDFQLCPDGFIQILNSCYKFISGGNTHSGKVRLNNYYCNSF